jgi:hypothetical protein
MQEVFIKIRGNISYRLPEDFSAEILTLRDLISGLERQTGIGAGTRTAGRQSWKTILSRESLSSEETAHPRISGPARSVFTLICQRILYWALFRTLLQLEAQGLAPLPG